MGRRPKNDDVPRPRRHGDYARIRIQKVEYHCGRWGSPEARAEADRLITQWIASDRSTPPPQRPRREPAAGTPAVPPGTPAAIWQTPKVEPAAVNPRLPAPPALLPTTGADARPTESAPPAALGSVQDAGETYSPQSMTVGEIGLRWLDWIEETQIPKGKRSTSLYYSARQAVAALEDFWEFPAEDFGSRELIDVQEKLVRTPVVSRPKDPKKPQKSRPRGRVTINGTIDRIRQLFKWAATKKFIPREKWSVMEPDLKLVRSLLRGKTTAPDGPTDRTVKDELVEATLPHLPEVAADLLRFQRLTGCRPKEARMLTLNDIDTRPLPDYEGLWVYRVPDWKLSWRERHIPRQIVIGPKAQAIVQKWIGRMDGDGSSAVFSPRLSVRNPTRWIDPAGTQPTKTKRHGPKKKRKHNAFYSAGALNTCIRRVCEKRELPRWTTNQLRHSRLTEIRLYQSLEQANAVGGHARINQTQHYAHLMLQRAIEAARSG
jgi:integrase